MDRRANVATLYGQLIDQATEISKQCVGINENRVPDNLFHFTDANGLIGIINSKSVWASLASCLNDCSEISYGVNLAMELADQRSGNAVEMYKHLDAFADSPGIVTPGLQFEAIPFVASFCAKADKSVHWLHYGKSGTGVALSLRTEKLISGTNHNLVEVCYEEARQKAKIKRLLDAFENLFNDSSKQLGNDERDLLGMVLAHFCLVLLRALAIEFKNPCFKSEEEWRLITFQVRRERQGRVEKIPPDNATRFRSFGTRIIPYEALPLSPDLSAISEVIIGNAAAMEVDDPGLRLLLEDHLPRIKIEKSTVPVR